MIHMMSKWFLHWKGMAHGNTPNVTEKSLKLFGEGGLWPSRWKCNNFMITCHATHDNKRTLAGAEERGPRLV